MKQVLACVLLAAFAAGPSLKWVCQQFCVAGHPVTATERCHSAANAEQAIVGGHDCTSHALPVALVAKRIQPVSHLVVSLQVGLPVGQMTGIPVASEELAVLSPSPPLPAFPTILRI